MANNPGAALAAMRARVPHNCAQCGARFVAIRKARYCTAACKQKAVRERAKRAGRS